LERILLVYGPSGVGKSCFGKWLHHHNGFLHLEGDGRGENVMPILGIENEWNQYLSGNYEPLLNLLKAKAQEKGCSGSVLTLTSRIVPEQTIALKAAHDGLNCLILYGSREECIKYFLAREQKLESGHDRNFWEQNNKDFYEKLGANEFEQIRCSTFENGDHKKFDFLYAEVSQRFHWDKN